MNVPYWSYIERYLKQCCATIRKPCFSVGIIRFVEDVSTLIIRDLAAKGMHADPAKIKMELKDVLLALRDAGIAQIADGVVVNFADNIVECNERAAVSTNAGAREVRRKKTLLDYFTT